ncbi:MAG: hypothetical protein D6814_17350 [Calditrichaeota bacterium]|nr:MAG: hypothetical protein D6814_17350 [Calditrichota bacterium]
MFKKALSASLALVLVFSMATFSFSGGGKKAKVKTISGTLVDLKCYAAMGVKTNDHGDMKNCGSMCAQGGLPLGIVDAKGNVYNLAVPSPAYAKYVGKELRLTGTYGKFANLFMPKEMEVKENGKWVKKKLPKTMM